MNLKMYKQIAHLRPRQIPDVAQERLFSTIFVSTVYGRLIERRGFRWNPEALASSISSTLEFLKEGNVLSLLTNEVKPFHSGTQTNEPTL